MPLKLDDGWNQIQFNLADFCQRAYKTRYVETLRIQVHCSCRVRRIFFSDRLYAEEVRRGRQAMLTGLRHDRLKYTGAAH
jgi:hypothetical protein